MKLLNLSNRHIRLIIQGGWQTGCLEDGVRRWQGSHVTGWSGCQWRIEGNSFCVCVRERQRRKHMRLVWWEHETHIAKKGLCACEIEEHAQTQKYPHLQRDSHTEFSRFISISHSLRIGKLTLCANHPHPYHSVWCWCGLTFSLIHKPIKS